MGIAERNLVLKATEWVELEMLLHRKEMNSKEFNEIVAKIGDSIFKEIKSPELHVNWDATLETINNLGKLKSGEITRFEFSLQPLYTQILLYLKNTVMLS